MSIEWKRGIRNYYYLLMALVSGLNVLLGYILLTTIDKLEKVTFLELWESVHTVYTQFGTLLFSSIIIMQFYYDYKEKNIIFYKTMKKNAVSYFVSKLTVLLLGTILGTLVSSCLICIPYGAIKWLPLVFLKTEAVMIYYSLIMALVGFLFENFLLGFFVNFFAWIIGIVISDFSPKLEILAYYDASSDDYSKFTDFIDGNITNNIFLNNIGTNYIFDVFLFIGCIVFVILFRTRWVKNGI